MRKSTTEPRFSSKWQDLGLGLLLVLLTLAAYWPVRWCDFVNYDDQDYVTQNSQVLKGLTWEGVNWAFRTGHAANWHPLTWLSHMLDCQVFGLNPAGHHLVNLGLHLVNTLLLYWILRQTTGSSRRSALVAGLFALHPVHVESVAWVAERKDLLSTCFGLLCLWAYARYTRLLTPARQESSPRLYYGLALLCFALALMSKPMAVTLPGLMLLLDYWPLGRWPQRWGLARALWLEKIPFLVLAALSSVVTLLVQQPAMAHFQRLTFAERAANAVVSYARYLGKLAWPDHLAVLYPHPGQWPPLYIAGAMILLAGVSALVFWQSGKRPYLLVGWLWFLGMLVPVLGVVQVGVQAMADRYTYLSAVGIFILVAWAGADCLPTWKPAATAAGGLLLVFCLAGTRSQLQVWRNTHTLFTHAVAVTTGNWVAHYNLALQALERYQETQRGALAQQALSFESTPSNSPPATEPPQDYLQEIIVHCQAAIQAHPTFADPYITLAKALTERGQLQAAQEQLTTAIHLAPKSAEAHQNLAEILHRQGCTQAATAEYRAALALKPDWPSVLNNLAWLLATHSAPQVRDGAEAVRLADQACGLTSHTNLWFLHTLAAAYAEHHQFSQAVATAEQAYHLAAATGQTNLIETATTRLERYRAGHPLRAP